MSQKQIKSKDEQETIYIIGLSYGVKPYIILETLSTYPVWINRKFIYITDAKEGVAVQFCYEHNVEVITVNFDDIESNSEAFIDARNSLLICIGWNKIIPSNFLSLFKKAINCHGGLLPDYRGDKAYMHTYANVEDFYGPTIHFMNNKLDDGKIILQGKLKMYIEETPEIIHRRISETSGMLLPYAIELVEHGFQGTIQKGLARYFYKISRSDMENYRIENLNNLKHGNQKVITPHKSWMLQ